METIKCDLAVVGGGPAGLSAAINGASEGLKTVLFDTGPSIGGQAKHSSLIENYMGFPDGIPGQEFMRLSMIQAEKFGAELKCPEQIINVAADGSSFILTTEDGQPYAARAVILSNGLSWNRLAARNLPQYLGQDAFYGMPSSQQGEYNGKTVAIIGGANSAGQAALDFSKHHNAKVKIIVRKTLDQMSQYLLTRIQQDPNIEVLQGAEVKTLVGDQHLRELEIEVRTGETSSKKTVTADGMFIFIGANPKTAWLGGSMLVDPKKFILTDNDVVKAAGWKLNRLPLPLETCMPGVFCAGDVRLSSSKRVVCAAGEGSFALQQVHNYLRLMNGNGSSDK